MVLDDARQGPSQLDGQPRHPRGSNGTGTNKASRRVALVADEDPTVIWLLRRALADDFDVTVAENGQQAVELAGTSQPDVILLDIGMPVLDGFGACRQIRATYPLVPIVIVSGHTDEEAVRAAFEAGATDYLTKPFTPSQLRARLQACLLRRS